MSLVKLKHPTIKRITHLVPEHMVDAWLAVGWKHFTPAKAPVSNEESPVRKAVTK